MRPIIVRVGEYKIFDLGHGLVVNIRILRDLPALDALAEQHYQRHLVHTGRVEPLIAVIVPFVAGRGIAEAEAEILRVDPALGEKALRHLVELLRVDYPGVRCRVVGQRRYRHCRKHHQAQQQR